MWKHEAVDFTRPRTTNLVIIENQLEPSNHLHLGQLLVYASGLEASTAVWITTRLRDEHRSALTWMNEHTDSDIKLFGIELSVVRIGDSLRAPVLDVVVEPNNWGKATKAASTARVSDRDRARRDFFEEVFDGLAIGYPAIRTPRPQTSYWSSFASDPFGYYSLTLVWDRLDANRGSRMAVYFDQFEPATADAATRQEAVRWSVQHAEALHRNLDADLRLVAEAVTG